MEVEFRIIIYSMRRNEIISDIFGRLHFRIRRVHFKARKVHFSVPRVHFKII